MWDNLKFVFCNIAHALQGFIAARKKDKQKRVYFFVTDINQMFKQ